MPRWIRAPLLFSLSLLFSLLLAEGLLRILRPAHDHGVATRYTAKASLYGWALPPKTRLKFHNPENGESSLFKINSAGWKDVEHDLEKPRGTFRILFVGDSYTYGYCPLEHLYTRRVQELLRSRGRSDVEVISMGVGSWGTDHALEALLNEGLDYEPDLVVYQFCSNDVTDNIQPDLNRNMDPIHWNKPFKYELIEGDLVRKDLNPEFKYKIVGGKTVKLPIRRELIREERIKRFLLLNSAFAYNLNEAFDRVKSSLTSGDERASEPAKAVPHPIFDPSSPFYRGLGRDDSPELESALSLFERLLVEMRDLVASSGGKYFVFGVNRIWKEELAKICRQNGIQVLLPPPEGFDAYIPDGHFNTKGNHQAATALLSFLEKGGWLAQEEHTLVTSDDE